MCLLWLSEGIKDTEWTELNAISQRCRWHKERRRYSVLIPNNFWDKRFVNKISDNTRNQPP